MAVSANRQQLKRAGTHNRKKNQNFYDYSLIIIVVLLSMFGLVMLYSSTAYVDAIAHAGNSFYTVQKQAVFTVIAFIAMFFVSNIDYHIWGKLVKFAYPLSVILGITVLFFGKEVNGQRRWFAIGPISLQPAEFAKLTIIITIATLVNFLYPFLKKYRILVLLAFVTLPIFLPVVSANLSSGIIIFGIAISMAYVASKRKWIFPFCIAGGIGAIVLAFKSGLLEKVLDSYQMDRIYAWFDPVAYSSTNGFQTVQGLYAIGAGGIFGRGLGESVQKMGYLPEAQNDMIFSIICEELGLFGASLLILLFVLLIWRFMIIANNAPDFLGMMMVVGVLAHIAIQVLLNIAVVTNTIPNTGVTLPFISYGGSSVLFLMIEIGLVLNVSSRIKVEN